MAVVKVEDLIVWQKSRELVKLIFKLTSAENFNKEYFLKDQLKRSAISVMSNIAEGYGRSGNKEFVQFLYIANGSLTELKSQLYISIDFNLIANIDEPLQFIVEIELMIKSLARKLKDSEIRGSKFK